jgi:hypothetical protein
LKKDNLKIEKNKIGKNLKTQEAFRLIIISGTKKELNKFENRLTSINKGQEFWLGVEKGQLVYYRDSDFADDDDPDIVLGEIADNNKKSITKLRVIVLNTKNEHKFDKTIDTQAYENISDGTIAIIPKKKERRFIFGGVIIEPDPDRPKKTVEDLSTQQVKDIMDKRYTNLGLENHDDKKSIKEKIDDLELPEFEFDTSGYVGGVGFMSGIWIDPSFIRSTKFDGEMNLYLMKIYDSSKRMTEPIEFAEKYSYFFCIQCGNKFTPDSQFCSKSCVIMSSLKSFSRGTLEDFQRWIDIELGRREYEYQEALRKVKGSEYQEPNVINDIDVSYRVRMKSLLENCVHWK